MIWYYEYTLKPRAARPARSGALIRVGSGYADVHPWPELGDIPLDEQLRLLIRGETTSLTQRSLELARLDAAARERGLSLFDGLTIPQSHWPGSDPPSAFDTVKLKSIERIPDHVRLRFDFNAKLTPEEFVRCAEALPRKRVDFVEDPCPYDPAVWSALREKTGLRLALDRPSEYGGLPPLSAVDVLVIKPALEDMPSDTREVVITSYMDHPVGQFGAAYVAALHADRLNPRCGLFTHVLYEANEFIERVRSEGARLMPPAGTGIGFDDLLDGLPWKKLR